MDYPLNIQPNELNIPIQAVEHDVLRRAGINASMARLDQCFNNASGNKYFKLFPLFDFLQEGFDRKLGYEKKPTLISFGGAYSNHLHALAYLANQYKYQFIAYVRGEDVENDTLTDIKRWGTTLKFITRKQYRERESEAFLAEINNECSNAFVIPSGGDLKFSEIGMQRLLENLIALTKNTAQEFQSLLVPFGTGNTAWGLLKAQSQLFSQSNMYVYTVVNDTNKIKGLEQSASSINMSHQLSIVSASNGAYAKIDDDLLDFIEDWLQQTGILLDPIYTGRMCQKMIEQVNNNEFETSDKLMLLHTGGMQAWRGMKDKVIQIKGESFWSLIARYINRPKQGL